MFGSGSYTFYLFDLVLLKLKGILSFILRELMLLQLWGTRSVRHTLALLGDLRLNCISISEAESIAPLLAWFRL
jgi:hypothetical protein